MKEISLRSIILLFLIVVATNCNNNDDNKPISSDSTPYFPPTTGSAWETSTIETLAWRQDPVQPLKDFLINNNSKSFMILVNGRIVMEEYFDGHTASSDWEWNSAGKSLVSTTVGIAQQEDLLAIDQKAADFLGASWTNMSIDKENLITIKDLLSMTSGIDDTKQWVIKEHLNYVADAGIRWAYGNVFQKLMDIVGEASNTSFENYFNEVLKNKIGMDGYWNEGLIFTIYHSSTRSMARFGLLALNEGTWEGEEIINTNSFLEAINSSQEINPSYGYLWWLNGKSKYMEPGSQIVYPGALVPNAPADMYAAMGANDQRVYVIPSKNMVVVRMGDASDPNNSNFAISGFDNALWEKINELIN